MTRLVVNNEEALLSAIVVRAVKDAISDNGEAWEFLFCDGCLVDVAKYLFGEPMEKSEMTNVLSRAKKMKGLTLKQYSEG